MSERTADVSTDAAYEALADPLRRETLCLLAKRGADTMPIADLVDYLTDLYDDPREKVAMRLKHTHLPKLQAAGFVEYDERSGTVRYFHSEFLAEKLEADVVECKTCSSDEIPVDDCRF